MQKVSLFESALAYARSGDLDTSLSILDGLVKSGKQSKDVWLLKADIYLNSKNYHLALPIYLEVTQNYAEVEVSTFLSLAYCYEQVEQYNLAKEIYFQCVQKYPENIESNFYLAQLLLALGNKVSARFYFEKVLSVLTEQQKIINNPVIAASSELSLSNLVEENQQCLARLNSYDLNQFPPFSAAQIAFAKAKYLDNSKNYSSAFQSLKLANSLMEQITAYSPKQMSDQVELLKSIFPTKKYHFDAEYETSPIFIVGLPRSGTTLIESIFSASPMVDVKGELEVLPRAISQFLSQGGRYQELAQKNNLRNLANSYLSQVDTKGKKYFTDKLPANFWNIGLILSMFPNAKIIHCYKQPIANAFSLYKQFFFEGHEYSYSFERIVDYMKQYREIMEHWNDSYPEKVFHISYEEFVDRPTQWVKVIYEFCGVIWSPKCTQVESCRQHINTASVVQVRDGISEHYKSKWINYRQYLFKLEELVGNLNF